MPVILYSGTNLVSLLLFERIGFFSISEQISISYFANFASFKNPSDFAQSWISLKPSLNSV